MAARAAGALVLGALAACSARECTVPDVDTDGAFPADCTSVNLCANATQRLAVATVLSTFRALAGHASIGALSVDGCLPGDAGLAMLTEHVLRTPPPLLAHLDLRRNGLADVGALAEALRTNALGVRVLDLRWNAIGAKGGGALATALSTNSALAELRLGWNGLKDRGARAIGEALASNDALATLDLEHNSIKDRGALGIASGLRANGAISTLAIGGNGVSAAVRQQLEAALLATPPPKAPKPASEEPPAARAHEEEEEVEEISLDDAD